jgi:hypothetical protein
MEGTSIVSLATAGAMQRTRRRSKALKSVAPRDVLTGPANARFGVCSQPGSVVRRLWSQRNFERS